MKATGTATAPTVQQSTIMYGDWHRNLCQRRLTVIETRPDSTSGGSVMFAVLTEQPGDGGASITNAANEAWAAVIHHLGCVPDVMIEHYARTAPDTGAASSEPGAVSATGVAETIDEVTFGDHWVSGDGTIDAAPGWLRWDPRLFAAYLGLPEPVTGDMFAGLDPRHR